MDYFALFLDSLCLIVGHGVMHMVFISRLRACLISRRVWIGEWIFCPARQKSAGILTDGKDF